MEKLRELRMTLIILVIGIVFLSGCFSTSKNVVTFKTNGGSKVENITLKSGKKIEEAPEPTKEGYVFEGWYLDGEEFDFGTKIDEDITLVAKWTKVEVVDEEEEAVEEDTTTTTTTKKTTTKKISSTNKTSKKSATKATTKKKTTTANQVTTQATTKLTTQAPSTTTTATTTTTTATTVATTTTSMTTTTSIFDNITVPSIEPTTTVVPTTQPTQVVKVNVASNTDDSLTVKFNVSESESNVESDIDEASLNKLLTSDKSLWILESNNGYVFDLGLTANMETNTIHLIGDKNVTSFSIITEGEAYIFDYDATLDKWIIKTPMVSVGIGINVRYYNSLETAVKLAKEGETITLLTDQVVKERLSITTPVVFEGANYKITSEADYLFDISTFDYKDKTVIFQNMTIDVNSILYVDNISIQSIQFLNVKGIYKDIKINDNNYMVLFDQHTELSKLL